MTRPLLPLLVLSLILPTAARAQSDDMAYCAKLSDLARRYLGNTSQGRMMPDVAVGVAMDQCQRGDTAAGIPVLEKRLRDARFTLPKRD